MQVPNTKELMLKISEDPLFLIKKQEEENRKQLAQNPIKMKKLKVGGIFTRVKNVNLGIS